MKKYPKIKEPESFIDACKELIKKYQSGQTVVHDPPCPLCEASRAIDPEWVCHSCPWKLFGWKKSHSCLGLFFTSWDKEENIRRLRSWIKIIQRQMREEATDGTRT